MSYDRDVRKRKSTNAGRDDKPGIVEIIFTVIGALIIGWFVIVGLILATCFLSV